MNHKEFSESISATVSESEALEKFKKKEYEKYERLYKDKNLQEYFHYVVTTIMMSHHKQYGEFTVESPYRFKAPESIKAKLNEYFSSITKTNDKNAPNAFSVKQIKDAFAMKLILYSRPPVSYSNDPELKELINEKSQNLELLKDMQEFKSKLIEDEYVKPIKYKYETTKLEYYQHCKALLERILSLVHPNATNLREYYQKQIADIDNCINFIVAARDEESLIDDDDLKNKKMNFFTILDDFTSRIYDKLDLAILTKQVHSLFLDNPRFEKLGISLAPESKEMRTEDGFVANFVFINTPFGKIECQLQSKHEYEEGNYGYSAHNKLKGKLIQPLEIPDTSDKAKIKEFIQRIREIAPKSFLARMDSTEKDRVVTQQFSDYQNYKNLTSQIAKGDPCEKYLLNYFGRLYAIQSKIFKTKENSLGFVESDIDNYINSDKLSQLKKKYSRDYTR